MKKDKQLTMIGVLLAKRDGNIITSVCFQNFIDKRRKINMNEWICDDREVVDADAIAAMTDEEFEEYLKLMREKDEE